MYFKKQNKTEVTTCPTLREWTAEGLAHMQTALEERGTRHSRKRHLPVFVPNVLDWAEGGGGWAGCAGGGHLHLRLQRERGGLSREGCHSTCERRLFVARL